MRKIKFEINKFYHLFNRGANKADIFCSDSDRWRFLQGMFLFNDVNSSSGILYKVERENRGKLNFNLLRESIRNNQKDRIPLVRIMADCLMPNHFHFIIQEIREGGISSFMHKFGTGFTNYMNKEHPEKSGSLFQGPFKAVEINNEEYLKYLLVYLHYINPGQLIEPNLKDEGVKNIEKVLEFAANYDWSTNKEYLGTRDSIIVDKGLLGDIFSDSNGYRKFAEETLLNKKYQTVSELFID